MRRSIFSGRAREAGQSDEVVTKCCRSVAHQFFYSPRCSRDSPCSREYNCLSKQTGSFYM
ncbi:hypothetical protein GBAR_LOCUS939, partial [Geodia barretti]